MAKSQRALHGRCLWARVILLCVSGSWPRRFALSERPGSHTRVASCSRKMRREGWRRISRRCRIYCFAKQQAHRVLRAVGHSLPMETIVVLGYCPSCKAYRFSLAPHDASCDRCAEPHVAARERCALLHVAAGGRCAAPDDASSDRWAVLDPVAYRALVALVEWWLPERMMPERLAASEPQHLTPLAWWSARQSPTRRLVREEKMRFDARSVFHSCWRPPR